MMKLTAEEKRRAEELLKNPPGADMNGYASPINIIMDELKPQIDMMNMKVEQKVLMQVDVDKAELERALAYDRNQYKVGFEAGYQKALRDVMEEADG